MSVRVSVVILAALALTGCKLPGQQQAAAPAAPRDCCCKVCPADAAPAAKATATAEAASSTTGRRGAVHVARPAAPSQASYRERGARTRTYAARETLSGGDYYASGDTARRYAGGYTGRDTSDGYVAGGRRYERYEGDRAESNRREAETRYERERYGDRRSAEGSYEARGRYEEGRYQADGYGGRYGATGRARSGVSVSVEESETSSERVRYRESSSGYASSSYGSSAGYAQTAGYYEDRDGRVRRAGPAGVDRSGYLTWPGKVED